MNEKEKEYRAIEGRLYIREREGAKKGESRTITGTGIVFNVESQVLFEDGQTFKEIILPSAATMVFLKGQDVKLNLLHQRELTVARWNKGKGSLRLWVDSKGVNFEFEAPRCDIGDRCLEMVRRGDYSGCSFEFWPGDYEISESRDGTTVIHKSFAAIGALSIGLDPAYLQTQVQAEG